MAAARTDSGILMLIITADIARMVMRDENAMGRA